MLQADETRKTPPYPAYAAIVTVFAGGLAGATFKAARTISDDEVASFLRAPFVESDKLEQHAD